MDRGVKWLSEISKSLDDRSIGIFCVTPGNATAPWLLFEAGAMSHHLGDEGRVIPYLLDFNSPSDLKAPLGQFNASLADEAGTWQLVSTLNELAEFRLDDASLRKTFDLWWPELREQLETIKAETKSSPPVRRSDGEKLDEVLAIVRNIGHGMQTASSDDLVKAAVDTERSRATNSMIRQAVGRAAIALGLPVASAAYRGGGVLELVVAEEPRAPTEEQMAVLTAILSANPEVQGHRIEFVTKEESESHRRARYDKIKREE